jgi:hypothetical protein
MTRIYAKIGTGPAERVEYLGNRVEPVVGDAFQIRRQRAGAKPIRVRCDKITYLGDTENLFYLVME